MKTIHAWTRRLFVLILLSATAELRADVAQTVDFSTYTNATMISHGWLVSGTTQSRIEWKTVSGVSYMSTSAATKVFYPEQMLPSSALYSVGIRFKMNIINNLSSGCVDPVYVGLVNQNNLHGDAVSLLLRRDLGNQWRLIYSVSQSGLTPVAGTLDSFSRSDLDPSGSGTTDELYLELSIVRGGTSSDWHLSGVLRNITQSTMIAVGGTNFVSNQGYFTNNILSMMAVGAGDPVALVTNRTVSKFSLSASPAPRSFPYRLVFNNDICNIGSRLSPYMNATTPFSTNVIRGSVSETAGCHCHMFSPAFCAVKWWPSQTDSLSNHVQWVKTTFGATSKFDSITEWVLAGHDLIQEFINACRMPGVNEAAFVSFRLNDSQCAAMANSAGTPLNVWQSIGFSKLYYDHPEYRLGGTNADLTVYSQSALNWTNEAVRTEKLNMIKELCNYDLDGIELDFMRQPYYFTAATSTNDRMNIMNGFILDVKEALDNVSYGRPRYLSLRIPCSTSVCTQIGIDLENLADLGVDMVIVSPSYYGVQQGSDFAKIRTLVGTNMQVHLEMTHAIQPGYTGDRTYWSYRRWTHEQFYTTARMAYAGGATGLSLFNFAYYRDGSAGIGRDTPYTEPPFDIIDVIKGMSTVADWPQQHYFNAGGAGVMPASQIPVNVYGGDFTFHLDFDVRPPTCGWTNDGLFRIQCLLYLPAGTTPYTFSNTTWEARLSNASYPTGVVLTATGSTGEIYTNNNPWTQCLGTDDQRLAWIVPADKLCSGTNTFTCHKSYGPTYLRIGYADLAMP